MKSKIDFKNSFGIEIENDNIKIAKLARSKEGVKVMAFEKRELSEEIIKNGVVKKPQILGILIERTIGNSKPNKIVDKKVICSLPENLVTFKLTKIQLKSTNIQEEIEAQFKPLINLNLNDVYYDFSVLKKRKKDYLIAICAAQKEIVDSRIEAFEEAGLVCVGFAPESYAISRCFSIDKANKLEKNLDRTSVEGVIYITRDYSVVLGKKGQKVFYSKIIELGKNEIIKKILASKKNKNTEEELEKFLKIGFDFTYNEGKEHKKLLASEFKLFKKPIDDLMEISNKYFRIKKETIPIYLTGVGSLIRGMDTMLGITVNKEILEDKEFSNYNLFNKTLTIPKKIIRDFSVALGLGLESIFKENKNGN